MLMDVLDCGFVDQVRILTNRHIGHYINELSISSDNATIIYY